MSGELVAFWILAIISVGAAVMMVVNKNPVRSALYLVATFLCVAAFYILLSAQFISAVQIIVYAGAIMVLFLFVIMLLNLGAPQALQESGRFQWLLALVLVASMIVGFVATGSLYVTNATTMRPGTIANMGTVESIGINLFDPAQPWLFPFEITSILLLVAVVGAIIMAKRKV